MSSSSFTLPRTRTRDVKRITGQRLQRIRARWFRAHPLCVHCLECEPSRLRPATQLDHKVPLFKGGADDDTNRQGLCAPCHAAKTHDDRGFGPRKGWDDDGMPTDPAHPWNIAANVRGETTGEG